MLFTEADDEAMLIAPNDADGRISTTSFVKQIQYSKANAVSFAFAGVDVDEFDNSKSTNKSNILHIQQNDSYSCGYRNIQMAISAMLLLFRSLRPDLHHLYSKALESLTNISSSSSSSSFNWLSWSMKKTTIRQRVPDIRIIQSAIEKGWREGFDVEGGKYFNYSLLDSKRWIGATEVAVLFRSHGIRANVIDFESRPHQSIIAHENIILFVKDYFNFGAEYAIGRYVQKADYKTIAIDLDASSRLPLYMQYQGHSITIIGIEKIKDDCEKDENLMNYNLVVHDPYVSIHSKNPGKFRMGYENLMHHESYQIVLFGSIKQSQSLIMSKPEQEESKVIVGITRN